MQRSRISKIALAQSSSSLEDFIFSHDNARHRRDRDGVGDALAHEHRQDQIGRTDLDLGNQPAQRRRATPFVRTPPTEVIAVWPLTCTFIQR